MLIYISEVKRNKGHRLWLQAENTFTPETLFLLEKLYETFHNFF